MDLTMISFQDDLGNIIYSLAHEFIAVINFKNSLNLLGFSTINNRWFIVFLLF